MNRFVLTHPRAVGLMVLVAFLWSIAGVVSRHLEQARSLEVTFWRSFFLSASLLVLLPLVRGRAVWAGMARAGVPLWCSGLCWAVMFTAFMVAVTRMPVANVLVTMALGPILTALLARIFLGHRMARRTGVAMGVAAAGIVWMYGTQVSQVSPTGLLVALGVPLAAAVNWTLVQHVQQQGRVVDLAPAVLVGGAFSALATLPWALPFAASAHDLALLALLGVVQLAVPCVLVVACARVLKAPEVALLGLLEVIFGIVLVWLGAGERPTEAVLLGGALVLGALFFNEWLGWKEQSA